MKYCPFFYEYLYIDTPEGAFALCPWMKQSDFIIGNLTTDEIEDAYNSEHANHLRSSMDDQSFRYCRPEACPHLQNNDLEEISQEEYEQRKKALYYPTQINMAYDFMCNQSCETCRPSVFVPPDNYEKQMETIRTKLAPHLNNAKQISASGHGDPFASPYMMKVLENLHPVNPNLYLLLETNGVFFDEAHWQRIRHLAKVRLEIAVTINSFDEFTYRHISHGGNFKKLMENLTFMAQLRKNNQIHKLTAALVIQDRNFREIPRFIQRCFERYAFDCVLLRPVYQWGTMEESTYWFKDVLNPCHPYHQEYLEILQEPILRDSRVYNFGGDTLHEARPYPTASNGTTFPYGAVKKDSRIILYGAGQIGREYMRQLKETQYCKVVLWIDKNGDGECVALPSRLADMKADSYDAVVLATCNPEFIAEMKETLSSLGIPAELAVTGGFCQNP